VSAAALALLTLLLLVQGSGPAADFVGLDKSVAENLNQMAEAFKRDVNELTIIVLERERHHDLIAQIREAGARIKLITDGDLSAGVSAAVRGTGIHGATQYL